MEKDAAGPGKLISGVTVTASVTVTGSLSATSGKVSVSVTVIVSLSITTAGGGGPVEELIVSVGLAVPMHAFESVAVTVIGKPPDWVGVPLSTPATKVTPWVRLRFLRR